MSELGAIICPRPPSLASSSFSLICLVIDGVVGWQRGGRSQVVLLSAWWISFDSAFWQRAVCWLQREVEFIRNFAGSGAFIHVTKTAAAVKQRLQGTLWLTPHITWSKKGTTVQWQNTVEIYQLFHRHSNSSVFHQRQCWFFSVTLFTSNKLN